MVEYILVDTFLDQSALYYATTTDGTESTSTPPASSSSSATATATTTTTTTANREASGPIGAMSLTNNTVPEVVPEVEAGAA